MEIETARRLWAQACERHGVERTMPRTGQMLAEFGSLVETAERERWLKAAAAALEVLDDLPAWSNAAHACKLLRDALGPNVEAERLP